MPAYLQIFSVERTQGLQIPFRLQIHGVPYKNFLPHIMPEKSYSLKHFHHCIIYGMFQSEHFLFPLQLALDDSAKLHLKCLMNFSVPLRPLPNPKQTQN